ncbi:hypothetical protein ACWDZ8_28250, partial [Streptomyces sp. NPDC003233]
ILNDLMTNNSVDSTDPFGFSVDSLTGPPGRPRVAMARGCPDSERPSPTGRLRRAAGPRRGRLPVGAAAVGGAEAVRWAAARRR